MTHTNDLLAADRSALARTLTRRQALGLGFGALAAAALAACGGGGDSESADSTAAGGGDTTAAGSGEGSTAAAGPNAAKFGGGGGDGTLKIGFTAPLTGPLAGFGEANKFTLAAIGALVKDGLMIGDKSYTVEIIERDVQSNSDTAASEAGKLITDDEVDLILAIATPEMINPVADQCEANGVPCLSTLAPWQPYFLGRGGDPAKGFDWTYHFFWGADQLVGVFSDLWSAVPNNKTVALLAPNDPDGNALADAELGFPAGVSGIGGKLVDGGRFNTGTDNFSTMIGQFKSGGAEVLAGVPIPPDFATFWKQAKQQGFNPKVVTMAKAILFPSAVEALGDIGDGLASEMWWSPNHPFTSSLNGTSCKDLGATYESETGKQWTQFVGFVHALFEVCFDVVSRAGSTDKQAIADAAGKTKLDTIVGPIEFGAGEVPKNVATTPLVGAQWQKQSGKKFPFDLVVVSNTQAPNIPIGGEMKPLG
jgi:branched-chain amino acid transport system substrate-binding protein